MLAGCTHRQLDRSTVLTTSTVMDIQYRTVLTNLAMMSVLPGAIPSHADLADGVVQVNDRLGFGQGGGFTTFSSGAFGFGLNQFGPSGQRQVTEQWGADATTDPQRVTDLQDLYRVALGLPPLPPPNAVDYLRRLEREGRKRSGQNRGDTDGRHQRRDSGSPDESRGDKQRKSEQLIAHNVTHQRSVGTGGIDASDSSSAQPTAISENERVVPIEILLSDVPTPGWFHLGRRKDVPKHACFVGRYCDQYCWVLADGVTDLSRFTVTVMNVVKLKPGEKRQQKSSLTFTNQ
jgi:hypothetical protein